MTPEPTPAGTVTWPNCSGCTCIFVTCTTAGLTSCTTWRIAVCRLMLLEFVAPLGVAVAAGATEVCGELPEAGALAAVADAAAALVTEALLFALLGAVVAVWLLFLPVQPMPAVSTAAARRAMPCLARRSPAW